MKSLKKYLESRIRKAIHDFSLLEGIKKLAIAISGGKDSLSLLHLLSHISGKGIPPLDIYSIYVEDSFSNEKTKDFVKKTCGELNIKLIIKKTSIVPSNCYICSRIRRKILFETAKKEGILTIAFGHHLDDTIETLFLNLFHKGEFEAMLPKVHMVKYGITIIRPFIYIPEKDIISFAEAHGFKNYAASCPKGSKRKKVKEIIELIEKDFSNVRTNLHHLALKYGSKKALRP